MTAKNMRSTTSGYARYASPAGHAGSKRIR